MRSKEEEIAIVQAHHSQLSQSDVAKILNVTVDSVAGWEMNRLRPTVKFTKSIISFLGYLSFSGKDCSIGKVILCKAHYKKNSKTSR